MEIKFGSEIILSYKRLSYTLWYAIAEFVDNSTEAYLRTKKTLDPVLQEQHQKLTIKIEYSESDDKITIPTLISGKSFARR